MKEDKLNVDLDFLEELATNTPHVGQFDKIKENNIKEVEEDLVCGKSLKKFKD